MSRRSILNRLGEAFLGGSAGATAEYQKAKKGGENKEGRVISAITGAGVGALATLGGAAAIRGGRSYKQMRGVYKNPKYHSFVDGLSKLENKVEEKARRVKEWDRSEALNRFYGSESKASGYPQNYEGAMDLLSQKKQDLVAQKEFLKNLGDPTPMDIGGYLDVAMGEHRKKRMEKDIKRLSDLTGRVRKGAHQEFGDLKDIEDYSRAQLKRLSEQQREFVSERRDHIHKNLADRFLGIF